MSSLFGEKRLFPSNLDSCGRVNYQSNAMKIRLSLVLVVLLLASAALNAQNLEAVLDSMDRAAANFHSAQTDFVWDQYQKVVDEHDIQKGTMYFRRQGGEVQMAADVSSPAKKYVLFSGGCMV